MNTPTKAGQRCLYKGTEFTVLTFRYSFMSFSVAVVGTDGMTYPAEECVVIG